MGGLVGIAMAKEMIEAISSFVQGIYLMPLDRFELVRELLPYVRTCVAQKSLKRPPLA
jgi:hypothetical protein